MPRKRHRSTSPEIRYRNMHEASGLPAMAGRSRLGLKATKPLTESVTANPVEEIPLIFHWPGTVSGFVDDRNGPGKFPRPGTIRRLEYVWDVAPASGVTVKWYLDGSGTATWTHSLGTLDEQVETVALTYADQHLVGVITAADATAAGLTVFMRLD